MSDQILLWQRIKLTARSVLGVNYKTGDSTSSSFVFDLAGAFCRPPIHTDLWPRVRSTTTVGLNLLSCHFCPLYVGKYINSSQTDVSVTYFRASPYGGVDDKQYIHWMGRLWLWTQNSSVVLRSLHPQTKQPEKVHRDRRNEGHTDRGFLLYPYLNLSNRPRQPLRRCFIALIGCGWIRMGLGKMLN